MSKRKKNRPADPSAAKSRSVPSIDAAAGADTPFWRSVWQEPIALGLAALILLRPWRDGLTFTGVNSYYYGLVLIFAAGWIALMIVRPRPIVAKTPLAIFAGFVTVAWLTGYSGYSYDPSSRGLQHQVVCLLVLALASNGLRTRRAIEIVIAAIVFTWLLSSMWTIFHYEVLLKGMRQILSGNRRLLEQYFGTETLSPELKDRLESNRAFGTFLFPNALGAFIIMGLPILAAALPSAWYTLTAASSKSDAPLVKDTQWWAIGLSIAVGAVLLSALYFGNFYIGILRPDGATPIAGEYRPFLFFLPVAILAGGVTAWFVNTRGPLAYGRLCVAIAVPLGLTLSLISLWLSYSRGAAASLIVVGTVAGILANARRVPLLARFVLVAAATVMIAASLTASPRAAAQGAPDGFVIPDPVPTGLRYETNRVLAVNKEMQTLNVEGSGRNFGQLADPTSFRLRTTYWSVGLKMFFDNLWTGVGLGNFKTAYPKYQFLGAGDVETAHNDFLQYFCETGILGGALFLTFWVYLAVWGGRRILTEPDPWTRRWLAAFYGGSLAFAMHTLVDFDFQNPSLSMMVYTVAGMFFAVASMNLAPVETPARELNLTRACAVIAAIAVIATTASIARLYFFELGITSAGGIGKFLYVGDRKALDTKLRTAIDLWGVLNGDPKADPKAPPKPRYMLFSDVQQIIPDMAKLSTIGVFRVPVQEPRGTLRDLKPGETPPYNTIFFFLVPELPRARQLVAEGCERFIAWLAKWDEAYPFDPTISASLFSWNELLCQNATDPVDKRRYAVAADEWARKSVDRSPQSVWWRLDYGRALFLRAAVEAPEQRLAFYRASLDSYKLGYQLYPKKSVVAAQYGTRLYSIGQALAASPGGRDEGELLMQQGSDMMERAAVLDRYDSLKP